MVRSVFENGTIKGVSLLLTRLLIAAIFLYHGYPKATDWSLATDKFVSMGFPGFLGPVVGIAEIVTGIMLILGSYSRWASLSLVVIIIGAIAGVQIPGAVKEGTLLTAGLERDLLILVSLSVLLGYGPGSLSLNEE